MKHEIATEWNGNETEVIPCDTSCGWFAGEWVAQDAWVMQLPDNATVYNCICIMPSTAPETRYYRGFVRGSGKKWRKAGNYPGIFHI